MLCVASRSLDSTRAEALAAFTVAIATVAITWLLAQKVELSATGASLRLGLPAVLGLFVGGAVVGMALGRLVPAIVIFFSSSSHRRRHVRRRAATAFYDLDIRDTPLATGVLVFVSLQERLAHVMADTGVAKAVPDEDWKHLQDIVAAAFATPHAAGGVMRAVEYAGELLEEHLPGSQEGNPLPDHIRFL